jgi:hypothetical protein
MNVNEELDERNQQSWLARFAQERQDLSISVDEALNDPNMQELFWIEEDREASSIYPVVPDKKESLFPPRLSLQSRMVMTVRSDGEAGTAAEANHLPSTHATPVSSPAPALINNIPTTESAATGPLSPLLSDQALTSFMGQKASSLAAIADIEVCTASTTGAFSVHELTRDLFPTPSQGTQSGSMPAVRARRTSEQTAPEGQKKRLAGRNTRVRLEVVPGAQSSKQGQQNRTRTSPQLPTIPPSVARQETTQSMQKQATSPLIPARPIPSSRERSPQRAGSAEAMMTTNARLAALARQDDERRRMTWGRLQAAATHKGVVAATARGALSGHGYFASGQGEVTINNPYVTEHSVVLVTLTSNPGPVVVQYVSLKPQIGFTIHLTAPTTQHTSFNYILLLGELF